MPVIIKIIINYRPTKKTNFAVPDLQQSQKVKTFLEITLSCYWCLYLKAAQIETLNSSISNGILTAFAMQNKMHSNSIFKKIIEAAGWFLD